MTDTDRAPTVAAADDDAASGVGSPDGGAPAEPHQPSPPSGWRSTLFTGGNGLPVVAFAGTLLVAGILFIRTGRQSWFGYDDWDFLAARTAGDLHGLLVPHGDHWSTLPILTYRLLWQVFGLSFTPYMVLAVALHLATAVLLRAVMRRAGVHPWIATTAASLFALFGAGYETTTKLFGLNFGGWPLVLGLTHLLLADHDGRWDRRDWLGLLAGLGALASSSLGLPMVVAVGVATWMRRGARIAICHTVPLGLIFVAWYIGFADPATGASPLSVARFVEAAARGVLVDLGQLWPMAVLLAFILVAGLVLLRAYGVGRRRGKASLPIGLLAGLGVFLVVTGYGRGGARDEAWFSDVARLSHYMDAAAAMILPALAFSATVIGQRYRRLLPALAGVFLVGVPGNIAALQAGLETTPDELGRAVMLWLPRMPEARAAPTDLPPEPLLAAPVTVGWLLDAMDAGRLPEATTEPTEAEAERLRLRLILWQTDGMRTVEPCLQTTGPVVRTVEAWSAISLGGQSAVDVAARGEDGNWSQPIRYGQPFSTDPEVLQGQSLTPTRTLTLQLTSANDEAFQLCG